MTDTPPSLSKTWKIKRIAPLQLGKILAVLYGIMSLVMVPFLMLMPFLTSQMSHMPAGQRTGIMAFGFGFALFMPIMYAAIGFVFGAIAAWLYNLVAKWIGGVEIEVE